MVDLIFVGLAEIISVAMEGLVQLLLPCLSFDFKTFATAFPYAAKAFPIFQRCGVGFVLLIAVIQLFFFFTRKDRDRTSPLRTAMFAFVAVGAIYYGNYVLEAIMQIAQLPYDALLNTGADFAMNFSEVVWAVNDIFYAISPLLYIIVLVMIGIAFIKLVLEAIERYVVLFCLLYLSPLVSAALASEATAGIFKRFFTMFLSQCLLLIINVWSLKMTISLFRALPDSAVPIFTLLVGYAFLRFASRIDSYLNSLGLNAAVTGAGLGEELIATGMSILAAAGGVRGKSGGGTSAGGNKNILGDVAGTVSNIAKTWSPGAAIADDIAGKAGAFAKTAGQAMAHASDAAAGAPFGQKWDAAKSVFQKSWGENIHGNTANADLQSGQNMWRRDRHGNPEIGQYDSMTPAEMQAVATTPYLADQAFNSNPADAEIYDSSAVSSIANGIGVGELGPEGQEAIAVGKGLLPGENLEYSKTADGMHMEYSMNGTDHSWEIKNATQLANLSPEEKNLYTPFKSKSGHQYYARHTSSRTPSEAQQKQARVNSEIEAYTHNPAAKLSQDSFNAMRKNHDQVSAVYQNMRNSDTYLTSETPEGRAAIQQLMDITPTDGKLTPGKQLAMAQLINGGPIEATADGDGIHAAWTDSDGDMHCFEMTAPGTEVDVNAMEGYHPYTMSNGETVMAQYYDPNTVAAKNAEIISKAPEFGSGSSLTQEQWNYLHASTPETKMQFRNAVFDSLAESGKTINLTAENQREMAEFYKLESIEGMTRKQQTEMASWLAGGEVDDVRMIVSERGIYAKTQAGTSQTVTGKAIRQDGREVDESGKTVLDTSNLNGRGYLWHNDNGRDFYSKFNSPKETSNIERIV